MKPKNAILPFLRLILKDRRKLLKQLLHYTGEADKRLYFDQKYSSSAIRFVDICELLNTIDDNIESYTFLDGTSYVTDIVLLKGLCRKFTDCNYLEIGSWRGESLVNVAEVATKCVSISLSKEDIISMGMSKEIADSQRLFTNGLENLVHIEANSLTYDFEQLKEKFDVIFIDGDHTYAGVKSDTINAFKLLRNDQSVIVWHDCGVNFEMHRYEVLAAIFDGCPPHKRGNLYRVTNTLCGIYTTASLNSQVLKFPQFPTKTFSLNVKAMPFSKTGDLSS